MFKKKDYIEIYDKWLFDYGTALVDRVPERIKNLMTDDVEYFENVLYPPYKGNNKVLELWKYLPETQKDISFQGKILTANENFGVAHWTMKRTIISTLTREEVEGVFIFELDKTNKCKRLKKWITTRVREKL